MCKQFFAAAHELYHIHCYAEDIEPGIITSGSLLESKTVDDRAMSQEDLEANAFAGLLLMPDNMLDEQIKMYGITSERISVDDILTLMELFALPFKAVVLRLAENHNNCCKGTEPSENRCVLCVGTNETDRKSAWMAAEQQGTCSFWHSA